MSSYNERIKNFEKIRTYMRDFYVYGFKSREEYSQKSARSYDDERRRIESWLGDYMKFERTAEGKNLFLSIDSRSSLHNPLYKAWKTKSFTDRDITLHFILFDILHSPEVALTLSEIMERMDSEYLCHFASPMLLDQSTVRKKLREYCDLGLIISEKSSKKVLFRRADTILLNSSTDLLNFFSEVAPCGVIGSFLLDKAPAQEDVFSFKHHYITSALDSDILATLFDAMRQKRTVLLTSDRRRSGAITHRVIPLCIHISVQTGRQYLMAYAPDSNRIIPHRLDYCSAVTLSEPTPRFDELRAMLTAMRPAIWSVGTGKSPFQKATEHVEFIVRVGKNEAHIIDRLEREKRGGQVERLDPFTYRFSADVYEPTELVPWIRSFICRITHISFSDKRLESQFRADLRSMYALYDI